MASIPEIFETMAYGPAPEAAAPGLEWIRAQGAEMPLFIAGRWVQPASGEHFDTMNPATGKVLARIAQAGTAEVDAAVAAARTAQEGWWAAGGHVRARYLYAMARQIQKHSRLFAVLESLDNGKPIRESRDIDIPLVARHFYHHAGWAQLMERELPGPKGLADVEPVAVGAGLRVPTPEVAGVEEQRDRHRHQDRRDRRRRTQEVRARESRAHAFLPRRLGGQLFQTGLNGRLIGRAPERTWRRGTPGPRRRRRRRSRS